MKTLFDWKVTVSKGRLERVAEELDTMDPEQLQRLADVLVAEAEKLRVRAHVIVDHMMWGEGDDQV